MCPSNLRRIGLGGADVHERLEGVGAGGQFLIRLWGGGDDGGTGLGLGDGFHVARVDADGVRILDGAADAGADLPGYSVTLLSTAAIDVLAGK